jgi:hypothetical protein
MFTGADLGFVQDPRVAGALFEESTGITPAVAGRPNGLLLDSTFGLRRSADIILDGDFSGGAANWTGSMQKAVVNGELVGTLTAVNGGLTKTIATEIGKFYEVIGICRVGTAATSGFRAQQAVSPFSIIASSQNNTTTTPTALRFIFRASTASTFITCAASGTVGQTAIFDNVTMTEVLGNHASQASAPSRPIFQTGPSRVVFDGVDDSHITAFPASLGSDCTVARAIPGTGAQILTGQTIGTSFTNTTTHAGMVIINRALTSSETANLSSWLNKAAGL